MTVIVAAAHHRGVVALVDDAIVRVRVRPPAHGKPRLPRWTCTACPTRGRDWCHHIGALAATPVTTAQLDRITNPMPQPRQARP